MEIKDYWVVDGEAHQHSNEVVLSEDNDDDHKKWGLWWGLMMIIMMPMMSPTWWIGPSDHDNNDCEVVGEDDDDDCLVSRPTNQDSLWLEWSHETWCFHHTCTCGNSFAGKFQQTKMFLHHRRNILMPYKKYFTSSSPPVPYWTNSTWSRGKSNLNFWRNPFYAEKRNHYMWIQSSEKFAEIKRSRQLRIAGLLRGESLF